MDLKNVINLPREEKLKLIEMMEEKERRDKEKRPPYRPNDGQLKVHLSKAQIRCVFAGNGGGKTTLGANEAIWAFKGYNPVTKEHSPVPSKGIVVLDKPEKVSDLWLPALRQWGILKDEWCFKRGKPYISQIVDDKGSEIVFMFHDQSEMSFESIEADWVIFDEPPPRFVWISLRRSGRKKNRKPWYLFIGTPIGQSWMRKELYEPWASGSIKDIECFKFGTRVNASNLADNYEQEYGQFLTEKEKRIRFEGDFFDLDGLALANLFDRSKHLIRGFQLEEEAPCVIAIDPHPNKKHVAILLGCDRQGYLYYLKEMASKAVPRDFAKELKEFYKGHRLIDIICDSLGSTPMSGGEGNKSFIQVLKEEGIQVRATTWEDKKDDEWIMRIQDVLSIPHEKNNFGQRIPKLRILDHNRGIIADIETVQWQKIKNLDEYRPKLDISAKDYLACLKYALTCNLNWVKSKARLYRRNKPVRAYGQR